MADLGSGPQTFTLRNSGNEALEVGTARVGAGLVIGADACSRRAVAPGAAYTLTVPARATGLAHGRARARGGEPPRLPRRRPRQRLARTGTDSDPFPAFSFAESPLARLNGTAATTSARR